MSAAQASFSSFKFTVEPRRSRVRARQGKSAAASDSKISRREREAVADVPMAYADWALVQQAIRGDAPANEQIFTLYTAKLQRVAFNILGNKEDAEDAVQDALYRAYARLRSFQGKSSWCTWLTRIVINSALMIRRKRMGHPEASLDDMLENQPERVQHRMTDERPNPEEVYRSSEIRGLVAEQLRQLPPRLGEAVQLFDLDGLSAAGASQVLGIRKNAFKSRVSRARQKVAKRVQRTFQRPASELAQDEVVGVGSAEIALCWQSRPAGELRDAACQ
jgi:RNA polymerase sigma-70 factor, ECF subfamily